MNRTIDLRNWALGAVIAAVISIGAAAGTKPVVTPPLWTASLFGVAPSKEASFQMLRLCIG